MVQARSGDSGDMCRRCCPCQPLLGCSDFVSAQLSHPSQRSLSSAQLPCSTAAQEHNGASPPWRQRLHVAAVVTVPAVLGCLVLYFALRHRPDPYWEEALGHDHAGVGFRAGLRDPAAGAALRLLFVGNSFVHRNEGAETVRAPPCRCTSPGPRH